MGQVTPSGPFAHRKLIIKPKVIQNYHVRILTYHTLPSVPQNHIPMSFSQKCHLLYNCDFQYQSEGCLILQNLILCILLNFKKEANIKSINILNYELKMIHIYTRQ